MRAHQALILGVLFMVEEMISDLSQDIRVSIAEDSSVPRNVRSNVVTGLETYLMNSAAVLTMLILFYS